MKEWIRDIVIALLIAVVVLQVIRPTMVKETSMQPTLYENDYLILSKQAYTLFGDPERGDVIVFHTDLTRSNGKEKLLIKRVIGLPGDTVDIRDGLVYINDEPLFEDYTLEGYTMPQDGGDHFVVPEGELFCMGDNRRVSIDSRYLAVGFVPISDVFGKAIIRLYPFSKITTKF